MRRSARLYQVMCVAAALAILLAIGRPLQMRVQQAKQTESPQSTHLADTSDLNSFTLGLLLGGFRGPVVMYLWIQLENEKNRDETDRLLTKAQLISNLQPDFAPVYVFQSWNLAYNVSVKYNRPSEKYVWIKRGIDFAQKGVDRLPHSPETTDQLAHLYFDKLGQSFENDYYRARFRRDSLPDGSDPLLDPQGHLLPEQASRLPYIDHLDRNLAELERKHASRGAASVLLPAASTAPDRDLPQQHRWTYGVSPFAMGYNYYRAALPLGKHEMFGLTVTSSRPAIACRDWADEELAMALATESELWPMNQQGQPLPVPQANKPLAPEVLQRALFHYREAATVARLARVNYLEHIDRFRRDAGLYGPHLANIAIKQSIARAGELRLEGISQIFDADPARHADARRKLNDARVDYLNAINMLQDYIATEYRHEAWSGQSGHTGRAPFQRLEDQSQRAVKQIDALLNR